MITGLWLLLDRDARSRAEALRTLLDYNIRSRALRVIERAFGHEPAFWPSYPGHGDWDYARFVKEMHGSRRLKLDPVKKPR